MVIIIIVLLRYANPVDTNHTAPEGLSVFQAPR
jgi:hypothetical protein